MNVDPENVEYLYEIADRVTLHQKTLEETKEYLIKKLIKDVDTIRNCLIMGQVWAAHRYGDSIKQNDLMIYLGDTENLSNTYEDISLSDKVKNLELPRLLDLVLENNGDCLK